MPPGRPTEVMAEIEIILASDTSTRHCGVALCRVAVPGTECEIMAQSCADRHKLHSERLLESVDWVLDAAGCSLEAVSCLAATAGPGSFTGLRIGLATWKGLAFALGLPLVAVPTLDAMARLAPVADGVVIPLLDARMKEVFGAVYRFRNGIREKLVPDRVCPVRDLLAPDFVQESPLYILGEGAWRYETEIRAMVPHAILLSRASGTPRADTVAAEAWALKCAGAVTDPALAAPTYLRASQAEQARAARLEAAALNTSGTAGT